MTPKESADREAVARLRRLADDSGPGIAPYKDHRGFDRHDAMREDLKILLSLSGEETIPAGASGNTWESNVEFLLSNCPHTIRCHEGGGSEDLVSSLVLTFNKMQAALAPATIEGGEAEAILRYRVMCGALAKAGMTNGAIYLFEAADTIERLLAALKPSFGLREALEPFARAAENYESCDYHLNGCPDSANLGEVMDLTVADLRRARTALASVPGDGK